MSLLLEHRFDCALSEGVWEQVEQGSVVIEKVGDPGRTSGNDLSVVQTGTVDMLVVAVHPIKV